MTPGEPAGIGPDIVLKLAQQSLTAEIVVIGDPVVLAARADACDLQITFAEYERDKVPEPHRIGTLKVLPIPTLNPVHPGILDKANARYVLSTLDTALRGCLSGEFNALVTGPVQKSVINEAGVAFSGHTEYLALHAGNYHPVMMLVNDTLRVALVTTHLPLREVADALTTAKIIYVIENVNHVLQSWFKIATPRIAVCGLNPHAGEAGHLGTEDRDVIAPALTVCRLRGILLQGPLPADTAFTPAARAQYDAVICMYHDQGLPVVKAFGFGNAVNVTLGLPFIRTSVDHGTALDLAGSGRADVGSLRAAFDLAVQLST